MKFSILCHCVGTVDILERNEKLILGLMWALIQRYQLGIGSETAVQHVQEPGKKAAPKKKSPSQSAKKLLLAWVRANIPEHNVTNFTTKWNDGVVLSALINKLKSGLIPDVDSSQPLETTRHALNVAEENFGIPQVRHQYNN